jgi:hypothetical protein
MRELGLAAVGFLSGMAMALNLAAYVNAEGLKREAKALRQEVGELQDPCGPGYVLGRGLVNAAAHEIEEGSFNLSNLGADKVTIIMPRGAQALQRAREWDQREARLVLLPAEPRRREELQK